MEKDVRMSDEADAELLVQLWMYVCICSDTLYSYGNVHDCTCALPSQNGCVLPLKLVMGFVHFVI